MTSEIELKNEEKVAEVVKRTSQHFGFICFKRFPIVFWIISVLTKSLSNLSAECLISTVLNWKVVLSIS